ncbi:MAG TPA: FtsQ-type POTRA domain-containing protein [Candidatus Polarisedimenticolia bacterium]|jgi:cell division septal protein FtsQ
MATPYRHVQRRVHLPARGDELKYLRRDGNRMVRARRRRRTALRMTLLTIGWAVAAASVGVCILLGARWAAGPWRFRLETVTVKGAGEALDGEIQDLVKDAMGQNILTLDLDELEKKVRRHPWIGSTGSVRVQRRLPDSVVIAIGEREAGGLALMGGTVWLLDVNGMPIDRFGPRYARYDFPIIKGLDAMKRADVARAASPASGTDPAGARLSRALARGVSVTRALAERDPGFYAQVSEIDVSESDMVVLRLEAEEYDLRLSTEDPLRNLDSYFAIRDRIRPGEEDGGRIEYVDLRWRDRIAVMPVPAPVEGAEKDGGR